MVRGHGVRPLFPAGNKLKSSEKNKTKHDGKTIADFSSGVWCSPGPTHKVNSCQAESSLSDGNRAPQSKRLQAPANKSRNKNMFKFHQGSLPLFDLFMLKEMMMMYNGWVAVDEMFPSQQSAPELWCECDIMPHTAHRQLVTGKIPNITEESENHHFYHDKPDFQESPEFQQNREDFPASADKLRQLIEDKVHVLQSIITEDQQGLEREGKTGTGGLWKFAVLSEELTFYLQQLQRQTEQELSNIHTRLFQIEVRRQLLTTELFDLQEKKKRAEHELKRCSRLHTSTFQSCAYRELEASITEHLVQSERLVFQEEALSTLRNLLTQDLQKYQEEAQRLSRFTQKILAQSHRSGREETLTNRQSDHSMQGKNETEQDNNMHGAESSSSLSTPYHHQITNKEEADLTWKASHKKLYAGLPRNTKLHRASSVKDLISKFSGPDQISLSSSLQGLCFGAGRVLKSTSVEALASPKSKSDPSTPSCGGQGTVFVPSITVTPPFRETSEKTSQITARIDCPVGGAARKTDSVRTSKTQSTDTGRDSVADSGMGSESEFDSNKQPDSPSEEMPSTPKVVPTSQNPKYQLYLNEVKTNGLSSSDADGPGGGGSFGENGSRMARWETTRPGLNHYRGSMESLASRDWDTMSDRVADSPIRVFNSPYSAAGSIDYNHMYRMSEYKGPSILSPANSEVNMFGYNSRSTSPVGLSTPTLTSPRNRVSAYDTLLKRRAEVNNTVIPTHYSMRSATLGAPNKKDYIEELTKQLDACQKRNQFLEAESVEMEKERNQIRFEMRSLLVNNEDLLRTNTQLNNEMKVMREKMIEMERENQSLGERCRTMEIEVKEARNIMVEANTQEYAFNFLEQSLKNRIQDAEENLDKTTQHAQTLAEKLWRAERQLEELQNDKGTKDKKTSELSSTILRLETELAEALQTSTQASVEMSLQQKLREDSQLRVEELEESLLEKDQEIQRLQALVNRLQGEVFPSVQQKCCIVISKKQQCDKCEKMIDLETDVEEMHESEQRWAAKHKRNLEQLREVRLEVEELQSSRVQDDVISRVESRAKELENALRTEERNKTVLTNTIGKLERRINELTDQMEDEHRIATEQKDLMTQRIRSLKRQLNEVEEEASRREAQYRHTQRELAEERETTSRLQRQLLDQHVQTKRKETLTIRQTLDNLRLDLSVDDEDDDHLPQQLTNMTKV
ncbi:Cingulin-like protein 1 Junction-associated coiled-coil protein Paracingulin [Channa argus]|uniref:Cingulin-like protein 1 Junction-associated coiled-coil protein Paracingulin n=1 Tax=Channa argus TaxID=215402 RepID=A0A6G1QJ98_CHAAH|nr:Cingulin-like protein 1 Junction-associated coiled-coil protein Paracingulin [Channa argus]